MPSCSHQTIDSVNSATGFPVTQNVWIISPASRSRRMNFEYLEQFKAESPG